MAFTRIMRRDAFQMLCFFISMRNFSIFFSSPVSGFSVRVCVCDIAIRPRACANSAIYQRCIISVCVCLVLDCGAVKLRH